MIKLRLDVDYAYPSRLKGFVLTALNMRTSKGYLKNSKIIARMINQSPKEVKAYWFFTPQTIPDRELLELLNPEKHEVCLHVATSPYSELKLLENATKRKVRYYTVHGTARLLARLIWRRKIWEGRVQIPADFPLKSFYDFPTIGLDRLSYSASRPQIMKIANSSIAKGEILHVHPEWLFQRGTLNHRGPYYGVLAEILQVDRELDAFIMHRKWFAKIGKDFREYERNVIPTDNLLETLVGLGIDIFTFVERKWTHTIPNPPGSWLKTEDNVALLKITTYEDWLENVGKKTRNMIRKAEKNGIKTGVAEPSEKLAEGMWNIYNETPIRQGRAFPSYGISLQTVKSGLFFPGNKTIIAAFLQDEIIGFIQLDYGNKIAVLSHILSLQKFWDKAINNALLAKAVEVCADKQVPWLMYGRIGNHPSLDNFKQSNGFTKIPLTRFYIPLTKKGKLITRLGLHREIKDTLPQSIKSPLIPVFNWASRTKMKIMLAVHSRNAKQDAAKF